MKTRIISGAVFAIIMALVFFVFPVVVTSIALAAVCAVASFELLYATGLVRNIRLNAYSALFAALVVFWSYYGCAYAPMLLGVLLYSVLLFGELLFTSGKTPFEQIAYCFFSGLIIPFLLSALLRIRNLSDGRILLLIPFIMAYCSDTGAYFVGVCVGKHKMCPKISPKKTWEGFAGGIIIAVMAMMVYAFVLDRTMDCRVNYYLALLYGILGALGSVFGDLMMSAVKRQVGIKDYGNLIPGHGGILDRFDSVLITAPLTEVLLLLLPLVK